MSRALLLAALAAAAAACSVANTSTSETAATCTRCHGDANRLAGTATNPLQAAPPRGLDESTDPHGLQVGAHQKHLAGGDGTRSFSLGFTCDQCHAAPTSLANHPNGVVDFAFAGKLSPDTVVNVATGACSNVYCHGTATPVWNQPGSVVCGSCHALPPATTTGHPAVGTALTGCNGCHPDTVDANGNLKLAGGKHVNGFVDYVGGHPTGFADPTSTAFHGPEAIRFLQGDQTVLQCTGCHGADLSGGTAQRACGACHANPPAELRPHLATAFQNGVDWTTNCTFCHGTPSTDADAAANPVLAAPPQDVSGANAASKVGAHQRHLVTTSVTSPLACDTCHAVPTGFTIPPLTSAHLDGATVVTLPTGTYSTGACASTYCHGNFPNGKHATPAWTDGAMTCSSCHESQWWGGTVATTTGGHTGHSVDVCNGCHSTGSRPDCAFCHAGYSYKATPDALDLANHLNGTVDVAKGNVGYSYDFTWTPGATRGTGTCSNNTCHSISVHQNIGAPQGTASW